MYGVGYFQVKYHDGIPVVEIPPELEDLPAFEIDARMRSACGYSLEDVGAIGYLVIHSSAMKQKAQRRCRFGCRNRRIV